MRLRVISDGTTQGTKLTTIDGEEIEGVQSLKWEADVKTGFPTLTIRVHRVPIEVYGEVQVPDEPPAQDVDFDPHAVKWTDANLPF